jgi:hypothetical protein
MEEDRSQLQELGASYNNRRIQVSFPVFKHGSPSDFTISEIFHTQVQGDETPKVPKPGVDLGHPLLRTPVRRSEEV